MLPTYGIGEAVLAFTVIGLLLLGVMLFASWLVRPGSRESDTYECGMPAEGNHRTIGFDYIGYAVLFLVFDLAALYLFLYAVAPGMTPQMAVGFGIGLLTLLLLILFGAQKRRYYVA